MREASKSLILLVGWVAAWLAGLWVVGRLPLPWQILVVLAAVLVDLIRTTGASSFKTLATSGPATLAGPLQPWQMGDRNNG